MTSSERIELKSCFRLLLQVLTIFFFSTGALLAGSTDASRRGRGLAPDAVFVKSGLAVKTAAFTLGVSWDQSRWLWEPLARHLSLTVDLEAGHWQSYRLNRGRAEFTQIGLTPMLRLPITSSEESRWFVEGGVGFHFIVPLYYTKDSRFSTSFNFQDLIGVGCNLGKERRHEVTFYLSHFSNANLKQPNPGENFLQLRYLRHFN